MYFLFVLLTLLPINYAYSGNGLESLQDFLNQSKQRQYQLALNNTKEVIHLFNSADELIDFANKNPEGANYLLSFEPQKFCGFFSSADALIRLAQANSTLRSSRVSTNLAKKCPDLVDLIVSRDHLNQMAASDHFMIYELVQKRAKKIARFFSSVNDVVQFAQSAEGQGNKFANIGGMSILAEVDNDEVKGFVNCMDLEGKFGLVNIPAGTVLWRAGSEQRKLGKFFSYAAEDIQNSGVGLQSIDRYGFLETKTIRPVRLKKEVIFLEAITIDAIDTWSIPGFKLETKGGSVQLMSTLEDNADLEEYFELVESK